MPLLVILMKFSVVIKYLVFHLKVVFFISSQEP